MSSERLFSVRNSGLTRRPHLLSCGTLGSGTREPGSFDASFKALSRYLDFCFSLVVRPRPFIKPRPDGKSIGKCLIVMNWFRQVIPTHLSNTATSITNPRCSNSGGHDGQEQPVYTLERSSRRTTNTQLPLWRWANFLQRAWVWRCRPQSNDKTGLLLSRTLCTMSTSFFTMVFGGV